MMSSDWAYLLLAELRGDFVRVKGNCFEGTVESLKEAFPKIDAWFKSHGVDRVMNIGPNDGLKLALLKPIIDYDALVYVYFDHTNRTYGELVWIRDPRIATLYKMTF